MNKTKPYHLSKHNNMPAKCHAKPGNCPLGGEHYNTLEEAMNAATKLNESIYNVLPSDNFAHKENNQKNDLEIEKNIKINKDGEVYGKINFNNDQLILGIIDANDNEVENIGYDSDKNSHYVIIKSNNNFDDKYINYVAKGYFNITEEIIKNELNEDSNVGLYYNGKFEIMDLETNINEDDMNYSHLLYTKEDLIEESIENIEFGELTYVHNPECKLIKNKDGSISSSFQVNNKDHSFSYVNNNPNMKNVKITEMGYQLETESPYIIMKATINNKNVEAKVSYDLSVPHYIQAEHINLKNEDKYSNEDLKNIIHTISEDVNKSTTYGIKSEKGRTYKRKSFYEDEKMIEALNYTDKKEFENSINVYYDKILQYEKSYNAVKEIDPGTASNVKYKLAYAKGRHSFLNNIYQLKFN